MIELLWNITVGSWVTAGAIIFLRLLFRKHLSTRSKYLLWLLLLVRLMLPVLPERKFMRIQDAVLDALEKNRGEYLSGEQLASSLGVSRNAVWKAIQKLEEAGHKIRAVPKRGYTLAPESDVLTVQSVSRFLDTDMPVYLQVQTEVTSTNTLLKAQAEQGAPEGTVLIAESQTAGKGRLGRHFTSPPGTGIYFSLLLRPHCTAEKSLFITTTAAVAVCEAIEQVTGLNPQIKWVNDVYLNEKKVCGILTEASVDFENGGLNWAVLGIGINIAVPEEGFPEEIRSIAGAIFDGPCPVEMRSRISAAVINRFFALYKNLGSNAFIESYRSHSFLTGRAITFSLGEETYRGVVTGISDEAHLLVRLDSGEERAFSAGEVQIHKGFANPKAE